MISVIFVACLLVGSALGQPSFNRGNVMQMQPHYNPYNSPTYALYPCESNQDPNGQWVFVRNQQHYVHLAECQQYNGQNNCAYRSAQNYIHPQTQPMMYIQPTNKCERQNCEYICINSNCFRSSVIIPNGYTGESQSVDGQYAYIKPAQITTTTITTTPAPTPAPTQAPTPAPTPAPTQAPTLVSDDVYEDTFPQENQFNIQTNPPNSVPSYYTQYIPQNPNNLNVPAHFNFYQNSYITPSKHSQVVKDSNEYRYNDEVFENKSIAPEPITEEIDIIEEPEATEEPLELTEVLKAHEANNPLPVPTSNKVKCENANGCTPGFQQHVVYHQPASSSSAASAASAGSASASASAASGSSSASASASASSSYMGFPGVPLQYNQQYQNQDSPCKSSEGASPCEVHNKRSASVNQNGFTIEVDGKKYNGAQLSKCRNSPCME